MRATLTIKGLYDYDPSLFDGMAWPEGVAAGDVLPELTAELAELELVYPSAETMKTSISSWSKSRVAAWNRIAAALNAEYNPVENYDRHEEWNDNANSTGGYLNKVAGFNVADKMLDQSSSDQTTASSSEHSGRVHGNIGVTMAQQMIEAELNLRTKNDMVHIIIAEFKQRFCLMVY